MLIWGRVPVTLASIVLCYAATVLAAAPVDAATLTGRVVAGAEITAPAPLSVAVDDWACGDQGSIADPRLVLAADRGVADVVVRLPGVVGAPAYPDRGPALIDQKGCAFEPHVSVVAPGQEVLARNSDGVLHNFRTISAANRSVNRAQIRGKQDTFRFASPELISVACDVHYWMSAVIVVAENAFTAVTDTGGGYRIEGLEPGSYTVEFWHERLGTRRAKVDIGAEGGRLDLVWEPVP